LPSWRMGSLSFQNDMEPDNKPLSSSFAEIKRRFEPDFSYVVIEKAGGNHESEYFSEILNVFTILRKEDHVWQIYWDEEERILFLVIKTKTNQAEIIMEKILEAGLPKELNCYLYRSDEKN